MKASITTYLASLVITSYAFAVDRLVPAQYPTIQSAIDAAETGDIVQISPGTYPGPIDFLGKRITVRGTHEDPSLTVISGGISVVRFWSSESLHSVLERLTVTGGTSSSEPKIGTGMGAGIHIRGSSPTIRDCRIVSNQITTSGGGGGGVRDGFGAGVCVEGGNPLIANCFIAANSISTPGSVCCGSSGLGAGVCFINSSGTIQDCRITGNSITVRGSGGFANGSGAAIAAIGSGSPQIVRCEISANVADVSGIYGCSSASAIGTNTTVAIRDCVIRDNQGLGCSSTGVLFSAPGASMAGSRVCGNNATPVTGPYINLGGNSIATICPNCAGDLNGDGTVNGADLGILLSVWGSCPN
jgi:hypothetical protein